jgi:hypothetical protein
MSQFRGDHWMHHKPKTDLWWFIDPSELTDEELKTLWEEDQEGFVPLNDWCFHPCEEFPLGLHWFDQIRRMREEYQRRFGIVQ